MPGARDHTWATASGTSIRLHHRRTRTYKRAVRIRSSTIQGLGNIRYIDSFGESFYHGLQVKYDKRYSKGLTAGVAYTLSKSHGDGENGGQEGVAFQAPLNRLQ